MITLRHLLVAALFAAPVLAARLWAQAQSGAQPAPAIRVIESAALQQARTTATECSCVVVLVTKGTGGFGVPDLDLLSAGGMAETFTSALAKENVTARPVGETGDRDSFVTYVLPRNNVVGPFDILAGFRQIPTIVEYDRLEQERQSLQKSLIELHPENKALLQKREEIEQQIQAKSNHEEALASDKQLLQIAIDGMEAMRDQLVPLIDLADDLALQAYESYSGRSVDHSDDAAVHAATIRGAFYVAAYHMLERGEVQQQGDTVVLVDQRFERCLRLLERIEGKAVDRKNVGSLAEALARLFAVQPSPLLALRRTEDVPESKRSTPPVSAPVPRSVTPRRAPPPALPRLRFGEPVSGRAGLEPKVVYEIESEEGAVIYFDIVSATDRARYVLRDPAGTVLFNSPGGDVGPVELRAATLYTLEIGSLGNGDLSYEIRFLRVR